MHQQILCDAAIALSNILTAHNTPHAFFGGFAILEVCRGNGPAYRESKDIDCLVSGNKDEVVSLFEGRAEWMVIPQGREDYVAFFWKNPGGSGEMVLVELFVGTKQSHAPRTIPHSVTSELFGPSVIPILSVESLFRGKLNACASRSKYTDFTDLLFLISSFPREVKAGGKKVDRKVIVQAVQRWPQLKAILERSGTPVRRKLLLSSCGAIQVRRISEGDVHRGLGCAW